LTFIKAFTILKNKKYLSIAENILMLFPAHITISDLTLGNGLAGLGEIYLEAFKASNNPEWSNRAKWINLLLSTSIKKADENSGYWMTNPAALITADLFDGNSGIIHFLMRNKYPDKLNHPLWI
jgi:hypothetical protein